MVVDHNLTRSSHKQKAQNAPANQGHWSRRTLCAFFIANRCILWYPASGKVAAFASRSSHTFEWEEKLRHGT